MGKVGPRESARYNPPIQHREVDTLTGAHKIGVDLEIAPVVTYGTVPPGGIILLSMLT